MNQEEKKRRFAWWWLLPLALPAVWYFATCKPAKPANTDGQTSTSDTAPPPINDNADIRLCTIERLKNSAHCCPEDLPKISIFESNSDIHLTANFPKLKEKPTSVTGRVLWASGDNFPTKPIQLVLDDSFGESCYVGHIQPINGVQWSLGKYTLVLQVNGEDFVEKVFEMDR